MGVGWWFGEREEVVLSGISEVDRKGREGPTSRCSAAVHFGASEQPGLVGARRGKKRRLVTDTSFPFP